MLRDWLAKKLTSRGVPTIKAFSAGTLFGETPVATLGDYSSYLQAGSKKLWATWKACDIVAKAVVDTPFAVRRKGSTDPVVQAPLAKLLTSPNQFETLGDLLYKSVLHIKFTGNAFWYKSQANLNGDRPLEIFGLNPKRMKLSVDKEGIPTGWLLRTHGMDRPFPLDEIIHFRQPHPDNDYYGLGELEAAEPLFKDTLNRNDYGESFWKNGASPSGILILKDRMTDQEAWDKAKRKWADDYGGARNAGKTAWLTGDWSYQQLSLSAADMQDIEKSKLNDERIFLLHGVPLSVAGLREAANYACLPADQSVFTPAGPIKIVDLKPGDPIWQWTADGIVQDAVVRIIPQPSAQVFTIKTRTRTLRASDNHPFLVVRRTNGKGAGRASFEASYGYVWVEAKDIKRGDVLVTMEQSPARQGARAWQGFDLSIEFMATLPSGIGLDRVLSIENTGPEPVYDLVATGSHTFIAEGLVVHNTAEIDDLRFRAYTVKPMVKLFEDTLNTDLVAGFGENLEIHFNVAGLVNLSSVVPNCNALFDRGIISVNEYRERVGMPSDPTNPLWDQHFVSAGLVPLELAGIAQADQTQQAAAAIVNRQILAITDGRPRP